MRSQSIVVLKGVRRKPGPAQDVYEITFDELKSIVRRGQLPRHLFRYRESRLLVHDWGTTSKRFATALLLRLMSRGRCLWEDAAGQTGRITIRMLLALLVRLVGEARQVASVRASVEAALDVLSRRSSAIAPLDLSAGAAYLRTDLWFGVRSGGSIGHIAGVLNHLDAFTGPSVFLTTDEIPTVRSDIETHILHAHDLPWEFQEAPSFAFNASAYEQVLSLCDGRELAFVYQRYSVNNLVGLRLARQAGVPFVLEYNGSEVWIARHWGRALKHEALSARIEQVNLLGADLVVVVSEPIAAQLRRAGVEPQRILVNPNGVDPERYSPVVDGSDVRRLYEFGDRVVLGFIGTFGPWHGAEALAEAFALLLERRADLRDRMAMLMIGDGARLAATREIIATAHLDDVCVFTGLVPQEHGPAYLAAADILVSPHVPNPDGTPFFGSPTKLFEYMAMGRAIVASDLDQIGDVLAHDDTALLVPPGDIGALASAIEVLVVDPLRRRALGDAARLAVVAHHTWRAHTERIIVRLAELCTPVALPRASASQAM